MATLSERSYTAAVLLTNVLVKNCPKDTWNLARNGIWIVQEDGQYYVCIGGERARYAVYTEEPWEKGKNPNEGWIERSIEEALPFMRNIMTGSITESEVNDYIAQCEESVRKQQMARVKELLEKRDSI